LVISSDFVTAPYAVPGISLIMLFFDNGLVCHFQWRGQDTRDGRRVYMVAENAIMVQKNEEFRFPLEYNLEKGLIVGKMLFLFSHLLCIKGER
jgi:hypothetical protein